MLICGGSVSLFQTVMPASSLAISWILVKPGLGRAILPVNLLRLNLADVRDELEGLLQLRCLQGLPLSASTVTVRAWLVTELWTVAHWGPLSMGFSRQECWSGFPCPPPGDLPIRCHTPTHF